MRENSTDEQSLLKSVAEFAGHGRKFERALATVQAGGVKECRFLPSGRRIVSVVGRLGDEFLEPDSPYCSCSNFYFRVARGKEETCYHLLSYSMARVAGRVEVIEFSDEEYGPYFTAEVKDVFHVLESGEG